jgi:hypothetical protein
MMRTEVRLGNLLFFIPVWLISSGFEDPVVRNTFILVMAFISTRMFPIIAVVDDKKDSDTNKEQP